MLFRSHGGVGEIFVVTAVTDASQRRTPPIDRVAESMILQYSVRRQEFVDQLNEITQKFSMSIELHPNIKQRSFSPKKYAVVENQLSMANESQVEYKS